MRIYSSVFSVPRSKHIKEKDVEFQQILPLKLRGFVSGKSDSISEVSCIHEMSVMFACFKDNDFNQSLCSKEIDKFQRCYTSHLTTKKAKKEKEAKGILTPGEKKLSHKQVNTLLKMFPNTI